MEPTQTKMNHGEKLEEFLQEEQKFRSGLRQLPNVKNVSITSELYEEFEDVYGDFQDLSFMDQQKYFLFVLNHSFIQHHAEIVHYFIYLLNNMFEYHREYCLDLLGKIYSLAVHQKRLPRPIVKHIFSVFKRENSDYKFMRFFRRTHDGGKKYFYKIIKRHKFKLVLKYIQNNSKYNNQ